MSDTSVNSSSSNAIVLTHIDVSVHSFFALYVELLLEEFTDSHSVT